MAIPINIKDLLKQRKIESERIEFKANWNPESVLHSICAFANDFNNWGGGYIVIGIAEKNGAPVLPPTGVTKGSADKISKELIHICNLLEPRYIPIIDVTTYNGKQIILLWISGSNDRPHSCPIKLPEKGASKEKIQRAYFIRKASSSIRANSNETRELFEIASRIPFDDRPNHSASLEDLRPALIMNYLHQEERRYFRVVFKIHPSFILSPDEAINEVINEAINGEGKTTADLVFELMVKHPEMTTSEIAAELRRSHSTIYRTIVKLKKSGLIKHLGAKKKGYWETVG